MEEFIEDLFLFLILYVDIWRYFHVWAEVLFIIISLFVFKKISLAYTVYGVLVE